MLKQIVTSIAALAIAGTVVAGTPFWDNDINANSFSGRALSPPVFPNIRVVDNFSSDVDTNIGRMDAAIIEDAAWVSSGEMEVYVYNNNNGVPSTLFTSGTGPVTRTFTGEQRFGRDLYIYSVTGLNISVPAGSYWIGLRDPNGSGSGTNYWMTSSGGGDTTTGFSSTDGGTTWVPEGDNWHHAFELYKIPAPGALALLGLGGLVARRRRRA
ncbi:MAG: hypothetical protein ACR2GY_06520 [Phycisphaerales bacterium]